MTRDRFSLNIDEDFEIYGIDPNEDLDDWSFLDTKPEPIPEPDEEEKRLFEQLLQPAIPDEEIQTEITDRLKNLIAETTDLINNGMKVELSEPIHIDEELIKKVIDKDSFEHQQASRVSSLMQEILRSTIKAEDTATMIEDFTKSDRLAEEYEKEEVVALAEDPIPEKDSEPEPEPEIEDVQTTESARKTTENPREKKEKTEKKPTQFLARYKRNPTAIKTILKDQAETDRMKAKFAAERKKREEELAAQQIQIEKDLEEKHKQFFESLDKEVEKHKKEVEIIEEIKNYKAPTISEMISNIRGPAEAEQPAPPKPKSKPKEPKPEKVTPEKYNEFLKQREQANAKIAQKQQKTMIIVELSTNPMTEHAPKSHYSKTFQTNLLNAMKEKIKKVLDGKKKNLHLKEAWKIAIFIKFTHQLSLARRKMSFMLYKESQIFKLWKNKAKNSTAKQDRLFNSIKRTISAIRIQSAWRSYVIQQKAREARQKSHQLQKQMKEKIEEQKNKAIENARAVISQQFPQKENSSSLSSPKRPKKSPFSMDVPEDIDEDWITKNSINIFEDSDASFLEELPDNPPPKPQYKGKQNIQAESQSIPLTDEIDEYLTRFNQNIVIPPEELEQIPQNDEEMPDSPQAQTSTSPKPPGLPADEIRKREDYDFQDPKTMQTMKKMMNKRFNQSNPYKNEKPVERFQRLYKNTQSSTNSSQTKSPAKQPPPQIHRSQFKTNDTRTRRLMKLKKVWLNGNPNEEES